MSFFIVSTGEREVSPWTLSLGEEVAVELWSDIQQSWAFITGAAMQSVHNNMPRHHRFPNSYHFSLRDYSLVISYNGRHAPQILGLSIFMFCFCGYFLVEFLFIWFAQKVRSVQSLSSRFVSRRDTEETRKNLNSHMLLVVLAILSPFFCFSGWHFLLQCMIWLPSNIVDVTLIAQLGFLETTSHPRLGLSYVPYTAGKRLLCISGFIHVPSAQNILESRLVFWRWNAWHKGCSSWLLLLGQLEDAPLRGVLKHLLIFNDFGSCTLFCHTREPMAPFPPHTG